MSESIETFSQENDNEQSFMEENLIQSEEDIEVEKNSIEQENLFTNFQQINKNNFIEKIFSQNQFFDNIEDEEQTKLLIPHIQPELDENLKDLIEKDKQDFEKIMDQIEENGSEVFQLLYSRLGQTVSQELIKQLIYDKTLIQKLKPLEKKLDYQINKLLKYSGGENKETDKLSYKPRPEKLAKNDEEGQLNDGKPQKYVVPKLSSALTKEDRVKQKQTEQDNRKGIFLKRKLKNVLLGGENDEVKQVRERQYFDKEEMERIEYEEENFVRLPVTKKDKLKKIQRMKMMRKTEKLDDLTELKDIRSLLQHENLVDKEGEEEQKKKIKRSLGIPLSKNRRLKGSAKRIHKKKTKKK